MFKKYNGDFSLAYSNGRSNLGVTLNAGFDEVNRVKIIQDASWILNRDNKKINGLVRVELPAKVDKNKIGIPILEDIHSTLYSRTSFTLWL